MVIRDNRSRDNEGRLWSGVCFTKHLKPKNYIGYVLFIIHVYEAFENLKLKMLSETESMLPYLRLILSSSFIFSPLLCLKKM